MQIYAHMVAKQHKERIAFIKVCILAPCHIHAVRLLHNGYISKRFQPLAPVYHPSYIVYRKYYVVVSQLILFNIWVSARAVHVCSAYVVR